MNLMVAWLNHTAAGWCQLVFHSLWQSALVGLVALAVVAWGRRWPAPVRYGLLLLALAKFAAPPLWPVTTGLFGWAGPAAMVATSQPATMVPHQSPRFTQDQGVAGVAATPVPTGAPRAAGSPVQEGIVAAEYGSAIFHLSWRAWLMLAHLAGTGVVLGWVLGQMFRLRRFTREGRTLGHDGLWHAWSDLAVRMGVRRLPRLLIVPGACSPMAVAVFRPTILLPSRVVERLSVAEVEAILGHELAHIRRGDLWVNWVQLLLGAVWWFHPVLWLVNRALRRVREDCCDDLLLARGITSSNDYCGVLVRAARELITHRPVAAALGCAETLHPLGHRVVRVMDRGIPRWAKLSTASLLGTLAAGLLILPGLRSQKIPPPKGQGPEPARLAAATPELSPQGTGHEAASLEDLFGQLKWFSEPEFSEDPQLLASQKIARQLGAQGFRFLIAKLQKPEAETDHSVEQRRKAAWALGQIGPAGREAVPALIQALQDKGDLESMPGGQSLVGERVCIIAASALGNLGPSAKEAVPALEKSLHYGVGSALSALAKIAPESPRVLAVLTKAIEDRRQVNLGIETSYRFEALRALALLAEHQVAALSSIRLAFKDSELCEKAVRVLLANKRFSAEAAALLDRGWKEGSLSDRAEVAAALSQAGRRSPELLAVMLQRVQREEKAGLSALFVRGLGWYGEQAKPAIPYLLKALGRTQNPVFSQALVPALAQIGKGSPEVLRAVEPFLLEALDNPRWVDRFTAMMTLGPLGVDPQKGIPLLLAALNDPEPMIRGTAVMALRLYGAAAKPTVSEIATLLEDEDPGVAGNAALALGDLGTNAQAAVPALIKALDSPVENLCINAASALGRLGPAARPAIPALEKLLEHPNGWVKRNAAFSLWQIDGRTAIVPLLIDHLKNEAAWTFLERMNPGPERLFALQQLGEIGPPAQPAVPLVQHLLQTGDADLRAAAQKALEKISPRGANL